MQLTAIIVNYNVKHYVLQCLLSLRRAAKGLDWEVFVVDNNSSDRSVEYLKENFSEGSFPQLHIIANADNPGFGKANNQAFLQAKGDYVLYINPDTFVSEDTLHQCLTFMEKHPDAGCLGVKMLNANGTFAPESRRGVPTPWASFCKITRLSKLFPRSKTFGYYYLQHLPINEPAQVEIVSGAFMMVKREVVSRVGVFDEDYFMYCEDTDLSYRMLKAGMHNYYLPTQILHYKGESTRQNTYSYVNNFYKAIFIFFKKHFNSHIFLLRILIYAAVYVLAAFSFLKRKYRQLAYKIRSSISPHKPRLLCLVSQENAEIISQLAATHDFHTSLCTQPMHSAQQIIDSIGDFAPDYIVYDTTLYSYADILNLSHTMPRGHNYPIGTLYPEQRMILTNLYIFK
ncbi:MAG: glycosyltransferase family 2 protein [Bacteroidaceae bacterium]|nr:glycosyltransferase family 2 protein [Bacteroidaceae bacterium]